MGDNQEHEGIGSGVEDGGLNLPPGFRFHPSDEEIIVCYLIPKVRDSNFTSVAIGEANINDSEPWELPMKAKLKEKESYFYCLKDHKYQKGHRVNRATNAGFWKTTGKDKEIRTTTMMPVVIGMKKTLVFYTGRAPRGEKTEWIMHEYRLEGSNKLFCPMTNSNSTISKDWVVCRVFHKSSRNKDAPVSSFEEVIARDDTDQASMTFPSSMQFQMGAEDFSVELDALCPLMDPTMPFYSTIEASSSVAPMMSPMASVGTVDFDGI